MPSTCEQNRASAWLAGNLLGGLVVSPILLFTSLSSSEVPSVLGAPSCDHRLGSMRTLTTAKLPDLPYDYGALQPVISGA